MFSTNWVSGGVKTSTEKKENGVVELQATLEPFRTEKACAQISATRSNLSWLCFHEVTKPLNDFRSKSTLKAYEEEKLFSSVIGSCVSTVDIYHHFFL